MSFLGTMFGTSPVGGQTMATNLGSAYNQATMANTVPGPLVSKQHQERHLSTTNFTVVQAHNGYVITTTDPTSYLENRYIAATMEEIKDLVASILVQRKLGEP